MLLIQTFNGAVTLRITAHIGKELNSFSTARGNAGVKALDVKGNVGCHAIRL